jgi:pyochelin biosynthetic protein PchC
MSALTDTDLWLRRFHPAPEAATRLVCLPHAGGAATYFFGVSKALSPEIDVLAAQYPGRQDRLREPGVPSVHDLADRLAAAVLPLADRPIAIFGHSLGASVGHELALRLEAEGVVPTGLFASGRRAPHLNRGGRTHLEDDAGLVAAVRKLGGTESALFDDPDVLAMVLPSIRNDYVAAETYRYRPGPGLRCPIVALVGDADPKVTVAEAGAWAEHTPEFELATYPGDHFYLNQHAHDVQRRLRAHAKAVVTGRREPSHATDVSFRRLRG